MIKEAVAHRVGVSIMPARIMRDEVIAGRLAAIPLAVSELYRPLGIIHRKKKRFHPAAQAFLELLARTRVQGGLTSYNTGRERTLRHSESLPEALVGFK